MDWVVIFATTQGKEKKWFCEILSEVEENLPANF
jgi:hypothetical protein